MLSGHSLAMQTRSAFHGRTTNFLASTPDGPAAPVTDILRRQSVQALMITPPDVMIDKRPDTPLLLARQVIVLK